jgi:hypothetical protein
MECSNLLSSSERTSTLDESPLWPELRLTRDESDFAQTMLTGCETVRVRLGVGGESTETSLKGILQL